METFKESDYINTSGSAVLDGKNGIMGEVGLNEWENKVVLEKHKIKSV